MKEQLTDELERLIGFTAWVKKNYGYSVGGGLWKHSLQYELILAILQKWLREEHNMIILITVSDHPKGKVFSFEINENYSRIVRSFNEGDWKETYEEALEKGLYEALKLI